MEQALTEMDNQHKWKLENIERRRKEVNDSIIREQCNKADQLALKTVPNLAKMISCIDTALKKLHQIKPAARRNDVEKILGKSSRLTERGHSR